MLEHGRDARLAHYFHPPQNCHSSMMLSWNTCAIIPVTPQIYFLDIEFVDGTVLIARTQEHTQTLLSLVQIEAVKYDL